MVKLFDTLKEKAKKIALGNYLVDAGLSPEFVDSLKEGFFFIAEDKLRFQIQSAIASEEGVDIKRCAFGADSIQLEIGVKRFRAQLVLPLQIQLSRIAVNGQEQIIEFNFVNGKSRGDNWLGKVAATLADGFLSRSLAEKIVQSSLVIASQVEHNCGQCVIDLGSIEQLQPYKKKLPVIGLKALDVLSINKVEHVDGGIRVKGAFSLKDVLGSLNSD